MAGCPRACDFFGKFLENSSEHTHGQVSRAVSSLSSSPQLAEKMVAMNKLSGLLGDGARTGSRDVLHSVAGEPATACCNFYRFCLLILVTGILAIFTSRTGCVHMGC